MKTRTFEAIKYLSRFRMQVMYNEVDLELIYSFGIQFKSLSKCRHFANSILVPFWAGSLFDPVHNESPFCTLDAFSTAHITSIQSGDELRSTLVEANIDDADFCKIWQYLDAIYLRTNYNGRLWEHIMKHKSFIIPVQQWHGKVNGQTTKGIRGVVSERVCNTK